MNQLDIWVAGLEPHEVPPGGVASRAASVTPARASRHANHGSPRCAHAAIARHGSSSRPLSST